MIVTLPQLDIRRLAADFSESVRKAHTPGQLAKIRATGDASQFYDGNDMMAEAVEQQLGHVDDWSDIADDMQAALTKARNSSFTLSRVLVACEYSGTVRDALNARGHSALSCDTLPTDSPGAHYQGDVRDILGDGWHTLLAFPPCTYLTVSAEWCYRDKQTKNIKPGTLIGAERRQAREQALEFVLDLMTAPVPRTLIENPVGVIGSRIRKADQYIQPYEFGDDASKRTGLWLDGLPPLEPTEYVPPRLVNGKSRWSNQTDSGQNILGPSADRGKIRGKTYPGIAAAMADQYGALAA